MMKSLVILAVLLIGVSPTAQPAVGTAESPQSTFAMYDDMFYSGKPDTTRDGFVLSNILYEGLIWPQGRDHSIVPDRSKFEALVRAHEANPGPLVLDIEQLPLQGPAETVAKNLATLATLADWAHAAAPGRVIGYYGTNTLSRIAPADLSYARELARHVDAFFPPAYTFDDDRATWKSRAQASAAEARRLDRGKPIFFFLWPQYHDHSPKQFQFVDESRWAFELATIRHNGDGIVLWSPSRYAWDNSTGWWTATQAFARANAGIRE